jgi:hypothetical protein
VTSTIHDLTGADIVPELVRYALGQHRRSGTRDVLAWICGRMDADGAILWAATLEADPEKGTLYAVADWFKDGQPWPRHNLPFESVTGWAILHNQPQATDDQDPRSDNAQGLAERHRVRRFCSIPFRWPKGRVGALNLYRTREVGLQP